MIITDLMFVEAVLADVNGAGAGGKVTVTGHGEIFEGSGSVESKSLFVEHARVSKLRNKSVGTIGIINGGGTLVVEGGVH